MNSALGKFLINLSFDIPKIKKDKINSNINFRNELLKLLLNTNLYDLNNYSSLTSFLKTFNESFIKNSTGLLNMDFFIKVVNFSIVFEKINTSKVIEIKKNKEYKKFKKQFKECLDTFFSKSEIQNPYMYITQIFANDFNFNYKKYQFLKIFYLNSEKFFQKLVDNKTYILVWGYFVKLYETLQMKTKYNEITQKEYQIIMAICIRIILEYSIVQDFYLSDRQKTRKTLSKHSKSISFHSQQFFTNTNIIFNYEEDEDKKEDKVEKNKIVIKEKKEIKNDDNIIQRKRTFSFNSIKDSKFSKRNSIIKQRRKSEDKAMNKKKANYILNKINIMRNMTFEVLNGNPFFSSSKYEEYIYFTTLFPKLCSSKNFNDYCFRSLLLLILEKNNEVNISQKVKYKFIVKIKQYSDLSDKDYQNFLKLKYYNKETKSQLISLLNLIENNINQLTAITFNIMLYLIIRISEERKKNPCVFKHLINSKKICGKLFVLAFNHSQEALVSIFGKFSDLIKFIIPFHKNPFIFDFLYQIIINEKTRDYAQVLINTLLMLSFENIHDSKYFYYCNVNILLLFYRIIKSKVIKNENYNFEQGVILNLFNEDLIASKYNMLYEATWAKKGKKKCYVELLFEVLVGLTLKTNNEKYSLILYKLFISYVTKFNPSKGHSILFFIDQVSTPCNKSNPIQKYFSKYDHIDVPSLTMQILLRTLKYYTKYKNNKAKDILFSLSSAFVLDAYDIFSSNNSKRKREYKNKRMYNNLRTIIMNSVNQKTKGKDKKSGFISHDSLLSEFELKYSEYLSNKGNYNDARSFSLFLPFQNKTNKLKDEELLSDDSLSSCESDKNSRNECLNNQKKRFKTSIKDYKNNNLFENIDKSEELSLNFDEIDNSNEISLELPKINRHYNLSFFGKEKKIINNNNSANKKNPFVLDKIKFSNEVCLFPKQNLIEQIFAIYFIDKLFYNKSFVKMRNYYKYLIKKETGKSINMENYSNYPLMMKNYIPKKLYFGGLFSKHDLNFFSNKYFHISHPYFADKVKQIKSKRIFKKKSEKNDINVFILDEDEKTNKFYVDLITNRGAIFGELIVGNNLIYFYSKDKKKFLNDNSEKENEKWLLCSPDCDYLPNKQKKIYIFIEEITEIINRRFLYSFQACEFYLNNGKSYYFNFYSEDKKIKFFDLYKSKKNFIITDLKSDFKKKNFTKYWLTDSISTLEYLLLINKYSCRSYNDVNQYPVLPWLKIFGDKERDLRYTIAAQTEEDRMVLKEMYSLNHFPHHYTIHYSNSAYLMYYLLRVNPFTDNQITFQGQHFDNPERQFTSIADIQRILAKTRQPREIIPEFFINTNFFYNYNCNYFGKTNEGELIDNLKIDNNFKNPLEYVLSNITLLESEKVKSTINHFFDDIFGVGQMGGCDKYNTYDKYCYQEMVDLRQKIEIFQSKGLTLKEIKEKIERKSNKIISFGQTPFKLLEDKHAEWSVQKVSEKAEKKIKKDNPYIKFMHKIIHFGFLKNNINVITNYCYILKIINKNYELGFYDLSLNEEKDKDKENPLSISIPKHLELFSPLKIFGNDFLYSFKYNPEFIMINYELMLFIFSHLTDNSFTIFNQKNNSKSILTESFITCIRKGPRNNFFTGHINGKIQEWKIDFRREEGTNYVNLDEIKIEKLREYIAHKKSVNGIYYSNLLDLILSYEDDKIYIRKYYDLSLMSIIHTDNQICIELKINFCHIYTLFFDEKKSEYIIKVYSLNGILEAQSNYDLINNIDFDKDGNVLVGYFKEHKINVFNPSLQRKIKEIIIDFPDDSSSDDVLFQNFHYQDYNNTVYCLFSNGFFIKKYIGRERE